MAVNHVGREQIKLDFKDGFAKTELLKGSYDGGVRVYRCELKAGCSVQPKVDKATLQILCLTNGCGAVVTPVKSFAVNEPSFFAPDPDGEYSLHAGTDMSYTMFVVEQTENDQKRYEDFHMALPFFKPLSQCTEYIQKSCKTKNTRSLSVIPTKRFCRVLMGVAESWGDKEGTFEKGHPAVAQWNVPFGDTEHILDVEGETVVQRTGDVSFVPAGLDHSLYTEGNNHAIYIWFEHYVQEVGYLVSYPQAKQ